MLEALFQPFALANLTLRNRFVMAPMARGKSPGGMPTPDVVEYYCRRAAGGVGLIITEGSLVDHPLAAEPGSSIPRMTEETVTAWRTVTEAVHYQGAAIFVQLWHLGPQTSPGVAAFEIPEKGVRVASEEELENLTGAYLRSALSAQEAGFDGIEIHGAHGYFIDSFLRTHAAVEPESRRGRFVADLVRRIRLAVGPSYLVGFRFSQWSVSDYRSQYMQSPEEMARVLLPLREAGVDIFHASVGFRSFWLREFAGSSLSLAGWTRALTGCPVITVGGVGLHKEQFFGDGDGSAAQLEDMFHNGEFDLAAIGRALIADPQWCEKVRKNEIESIIPFREEHLQQYP